MFSLLKTVYRKQLEYLERYSINIVNKEHFILLYYRARNTALIARDIRSS